MFDDDTCGVKGGGEGVDDVVVALVEETRLDAGSLMDSFLVVEVITVAASFGAGDLTKSELDDLLEDMRWDLRTEVLVGDCGVNGAGDETA